MLKSPITPGQFNGRQKQYTAFIYNVKKINTTPLLKFLKRKYHDHLQVIVEPKYDGLYLQISKKGNEIKIYSDQGNELTHQIDPQIIKALTRVPSQDLVAEGELESYIKGVHQPRGVTIGLTHGIKFTRSKAHTVLTLFDLLYKNKDISNLPTLKRLNELYKLNLPHKISPIHTSLNLVPYIKALNYVTLTKAIHKFTQISHFEGVILKDLNQTARHLHFIKFKKYIEFTLQVIKIIPTHTPHVYNYDLAAFDSHGKLIKIARSHNSRLKLNVGDSVIVACFNVSLYLDKNEKFQKVQLYSTTIQSTTTASPNTIKTIIKTAKIYSILEIHKVVF